MRQGIHRPNDCHAVLLPYVQQSGIQGSHPKRQGRKIKTDTIRIKTKEIREIQARDVLTVSEVAALVGCSRRTAYRLAATGTIKSANLGQRLTRIRRSEVDSFLSLPANPPRKRKSTKFQNATPSAKPCEHSVYRTRLSVTS